MITIKTDEREFSCPTKWDEINCKTYLQLLELETNREKYQFDFLYTQRFLEILCGVEEGGLDDLELEYLASLEPIITEGLSAKNLTDITATVDHFVFNGITYSFYTPETIKKITLGEQAFIETLKAVPKEVGEFEDAIEIIKQQIEEEETTERKQGLLQSLDLLQKQKEQLLQQHRYDQLIKAAAVMIRPAKQVTTSEGRTYWKLDRFNSEDVEYRAKILEENLNTKDLVMLNNFFLTGATI